MRPPRENLGYLLGIIGVIVFAGTLPAQRLAVVAIDPWFLTMARGTIAGVIALAILLVLRRPLPPRDTWLAFGLAAVTLVYGFPLFSALGMVTLPAAHGAVVLGALPLATAAAATVLAGERPSLGFWLAGLVGAALVVAFAVRRGAGAPAPGDWMLLVSVIAAAIGYTLGARLSFSMPGWESICWSLVLILPVSMLGTVLSWPADLAAIPAPAWGGLLYTSLMSQLIGFFAWNAGLALGGIARVGQMQLLQPFVGVALAALVNRETIDLETILFAAAVIVTVMVGRATQVRRNQAEAK